MTDDQLKAGLSSEDPMAMARAASLDELQRLSAAEDILEKAHLRKARRTRWVTLAQAMVGYVALAGFFANAYQNWNNKKQAEERARADEERWSKEFKRAQDADKYRAFFETSALATDPQNADKRLVGYALLKEFVDDKDYNSKATFMLEESLALELRDDKAPGLDEPHRAAVVAILTALSHTSDCHALARAARSIDRLASRHAESKDVAESREVLSLYILRLVGRGAVACGSKDFLDIRKPIRDLVTRLPELAGFSSGVKITSVAADQRIAQIAQTRCQEEIDAGVSECADLPKAWAKQCADQSKQKLSDGSGLCQPQ